MNISLIPTDLIDVVWPQCLPILEVVAKGNPTDVNLDKLKEYLLEGSNSLIVVSEGVEIIAVISCVINHLDSGMKALYFPVISGTKMELWMDDFMVFAKDLAGKMGCDELRGMAVRPGWIRALKHHDWEEHYVVLKCKLNNEVVT